MRFSASRGLQEKKNRGMRFSTGRGFWEKVREEGRIRSGRILLSWEKLQNQVLKSEQSLFELELFRSSHCILYCLIFAPFFSISCWCLGLFPMIESGHQKSYISKTICIHFLFGFSILTESEIIYYFFALFWFIYKMSATICFFFPFIFRVHFAHSQSVYKLIDKL